MTNELAERYKRACALKNPLNEAIIADRVKDHYLKLHVNPDPLVKFTTLKSFWDAREAVAKKALAKRDAATAEDDGYDEDIVEGMSTYATEDIVPDMNAPVASGTWGTGHTWAAVDAMNDIAAERTWVADGAINARAIRAHKNAIDALCAKETRRSPLAHDDWYAETDVEGDILDAHLYSASAAARAAWNVWVSRISRAVWNERPVWDPASVTEICLCPPCHQYTIRLDRWMPIFEAMENGLWMYFYGDEYFGWLPQPNMVVRDTPLHLREIHNESGPAFELPDEKLYFLNGVMVPAEITMTPAAKINPSVILGEKNAEVRREIVRKIGVERVCSRLGAKVVDKQGDYELLNLNLGEEIYRPYLKMKNPSLKTWHLEGVHPSCRTVQQALSWRSYGKIDRDWSPFVLT